MRILDNFLENKYQKKQAVIIAIFLAIFLLFIFMLYSWLRPVQTCSDGKQNQNEEGVDCGGVCAKKCEVKVITEVTVLESGFVPSGVVNSYDVYARIANPNNVFGSSGFQYEFTLKDSAGQIIATKKGTNYMLPGETKYVVENNLVTDKSPASVEFVATNPTWVEFKDQYEKPQLKVVNKQYNQISSGVGFSEVLGLLKNESPFDFNLITLKIILKDSNNKVVALNSTEMRTVKSGENRDFRALWLSRFSGEVMNVEVQAEANVFDSESFTAKNFVPVNQGTDYR